MQCGKCGRKLFSFFRMHAAVGASDGIRGVKQLQDTFEVFCNYALKGGRYAGKH